jgi:GntR family transcriptional regulator/MocR family aminotransferase
LKRAAAVTVPPLSLDRRRPLARQISDGLRIAIQAGRLAPSSRVPATRALARVLGVSRQVVVAAYEELAATGHLRGRIGDGSYVAVTERQHWTDGPTRALEDPDGYTIFVRAIQ